MVELKDIIEKRFADKLKNARVAGLDIGSRATKGVLLYDGRLYDRIITSGVSSQETAIEVLQELLSEAGRTEKELDYIVGTGYGRIAIELGRIPFQILTEISCHAMGGHYLNPKTQTILDIGGQDSKAIKVDANNGKVIEFIMNDKCAAGTGRFLEKVAQLLELELDELGEYAVRAKAPVEISSQCVVFAESEVISLKAKGSRREDIAAGIHLATARRVKNLLRKVGLEPTVLFTGGVTNNPGMRRALEEVLETKLGETKLDTTLAGAFGAAIYANDFAQELNAGYGGDI
jgi:predicted CoA-substrate-specific enzyme activase